MGKKATTLFIKTKNKDLLIVQIYVDDIVFGSTNDGFVRNSIHAWGRNLK